MQREESQRVKELSRKADQDPVAAEQRERRMVELEAELEQLVGWGSEEAWRMWQGQNSKSPG